jgi:hypothetical protein
MADNVAITAGAGTNVATDDIGGNHYQRVKPAWGTDGNAVDASTSNPFPIQVIPTISGGTPINRVISAATTNSTNIKGSAGKIHGIIAVNTNASVRYLKYYDKATAPTVGTDTPVITIPLPSGGGVAFPYTQGIPFSAGIGLGITTGAADADTGSVAANEIIVTTLYI